MQAKSVLAYPVNAFVGREYVPHEWREVPPGFEKQAESNPYLDTRPSPTPAEIDATDAARELADEHGISLAAVEGSGEDGRVLVADVRALVEEEA